jgi:NAD(P)-dependent dehydrogenase (short-subunit alcohol dehydrogenase family)
MLAVDLRGKTVLLTGASKGIGAATAKFLVESGAHLIAHFGGDRAGAEQATINATSSHCLLVQADLAQIADVDRLWEAALTWRGRIDVLINNAATMPFYGGFDAPIEDWEQAWDQCHRVNVLAPARLMRSAVNHFQGAGGGSIISISSWAAQRGVTNPATMAYGASKAAIRAATQSVARAYARDRIQAYVIAPGVVRTRLSEEFAASQGGEERVSAGLASGEWVTPEEVARLVAVLASGTAPQLSGATLDVNGASYIR